MQLKPLCSSDAEALCRASSICRKNFRFNPVPNGIQETVQYINRALVQKAAGNRFPFVIIWKCEIVGTTSYSAYQPWQWPDGCSLQRQDLPDVLEIGYTWISTKAQRTRCNTETKYLLLRNAFEGLEVHRVSFRTDERNEISKKSIERLGAKFEGIRRADMPGEDSTARNSAYYSIIKNEWNSVRINLERKLSDNYINQSAIK